MVRRQAADGFQLGESLWKVKKDLSHAIVKKVQKKKGGGIEKGRMFLYIRSSLNGKEKAPESGFSKQKPFS